MVLPQDSNALAATREKILKIIEVIVKIGFPNTDNIEALKVHVNDLLSLISALNHSDKVAIKHIEKALQKIEHQLVEEGTASEKMYTLFSKRLIILKTSLRNKHS